MSDIFGNTFGNILGPSIGSALGMQNQQYTPNQMALMQAQAQHRTAVIQMQMAQNAAYRQNPLLHTAMTNGYVPFKPQPTVARTAASRVQKSDWEAEQDRKDAEVDAWLQAVYDQGAD